MPLYDFRCTSCNHQYQVFVSYSKRDEVPCPACGEKGKEPVFKANVKGPVTGSGSSGSSCGSSGFT
ncbi:FmdB family zinc ribbon protein [Rubeoparvulum massiliense]|uniref:FmdB family zinc ribbon protein n=1 Tax=Rubeoparvulum massiliense TaxID=1631346 RepID=UPI00065E282B|nr:zinc ribbon domain-containing protein [Rubeoparvulum massiliense]